MEQYFFAGKERIFAFAEPERADYAAILFPKEDERRLKFEIERMDEDGMRHIVSRVLDRMEEARQPIETNIRVCLELLHCFQAGFKMFGEDAFQQLEKEMPMYKRVIRFEELAEARLWFEQFIAAYSSRARDIWGKTHREEIQKLILYIKSNYAIDLSLKQAAEMVNVSEGYLSHLFKKELHKSFTEYVNQIRVDKAAELLHETNWPHYKIAEQVGYENINYFGRVFKKLKGMSPKQYRAQFPKASDSSVPLE
ncbi:hypothetical protein SD70_22115 [Gordoniibacillus kamchatkensis]|uniref:HTH araC/xylS-type domain-containing protein n=1 Tax=Gordoniibacillus kamchatkensis TaxID=1590651 RepID=A0ABR5AE16_9BACL|nr:hypothetical protein SD70_22115 [Paenibacillus sp. VKM B-2647]